MIARFAAALFALGLTAAPAFAQWTKVPQVLANDVFAVWANGDTIVAGVDTATWVSTNAGASWKVSARVYSPAVPLAPVDAVLLRNGRLYAGTFGQGVFVSDDLGDHWQPFNEGLTGGFADSQLDVGSLVVRSDTIYAGTLGAGVYRRRLAPGETWHPFGAIFEPEQATNIEDLGLGGTRLLAGAGANGEVFTQDPGEPDFTEVFLNNVGLAPGLQALAVQWWGGGWVVWAGVGAFRSANGDNPWSFTNFGVGSVANAAFASRNGHVFAGVTHLTTLFILTSGDGGATWQTLDSLPSAFAYKLAVSGVTLYAGRLDGLWRRSVEAVDVPPPSGASRLSLAPVVSAGDALRLRFTLPAAGKVAIALYDVRGRRVGDRVEGTYGAGPQVAEFPAAALAPGVYVARLDANGETVTARVVRLR